MACYNGRRAERLDDGRDGTRSAVDRARCGGTPDCVDCGTGAGQGFTRMACMPQSGGCERRRTEPFVEHLNELERSCYRHERCLDMEPSGRPQPEASYVDAATRKSLVIERKCLMWPLDYAERHHNDHLVADWITEQVGDGLRGAPYELELPELIQGPREELRSFAASVSRDALARFALLEPGPAIEGACGPRGWRLRRQPESERDPDQPATGLIFCWWSPIDYPDSESRHEAREGLVHSLERHFAACVRKFAGYEEARRVLVLEVVGNFDPVDEDWRVMLKQVPPPKEIDEIWSSQHFAGSEEPWLFEKIFPTDAHGCPGVR
jgi:hypothetical protein